MSESLNEVMAAAAKAREDKQRQADLEAIRHLDFEPNDCCAVRVGGPSGDLCPTLAEWATVCTHCGNTSLFCGKHRIWLLQRRHHNFGCLDCGRRGLLFKVFRIVPYRRSA